MILESTVMFPLGCFPVKRGCRRLWLCWSAPSPRPEVPDEVSEGLGPREAVPSTPLLGDVATRTGRVEGGLPARVGGVQGVVLLGLQQRSKIEVIRSQYDYSWRCPACRTLEAATVGRWRSYRVVRKVAICVEVKEVIMYIEVMQVKYR